MTTRSMAVTKPKRSAASRNSSGLAREPSSSRSRTRVSTATMRPVETSAIGWKTGTKRAGGEGGADPVGLPVEDADPLPLPRARVVEDEAGASPRLGLVHREVGREHQVGRALAVRGVDRDADARGDLEPPPLEGRRELRQEPYEVVGLERGLGGGRVGGEEAELVPARAGRRPGRGAGPGVSASPRRRRYSSPGGEAVRVVQGLEVVEVEEEERERTPGRGPRPRSPGRGAPGTPRA